jgi:3-phosphoshikimate 1-carboxyvinyltransferase
MMNPTRAGFVEVLRRMGASIDEDLAGDSGSGERVATLRVRGGPLRGISIGAGQVPSMIDELPLLACVASRVSGETLITGAAELRVKESDRIRTVVENLQALGVDAEELPDGMRIVGGRRPLRGRVRTHGDHRIAMAFGVLAAMHGSEIQIDDRDCVAVSFPAFWDELRRVTR